MASSESDEIDTSGEYSARSGSWILSSNLVESGLIVAPGHMCMTRFELVQRADRVLIEAADGLAIYAVRVEDRVAWRRSVGDRDSGGARIWIPLRPPAESRQYLVVEVEPAGDRPTAVRLIAWTMDDRTGTILGEASGFFRGVGLAKFVTRVGAGRPATHPTGR